MGQSLSQLYVHLTFSTKRRQPFINPEIKTELHSYLAGALKQYESPALKINSMPDHVHILFRLSKNYALAKIVEELKKESSKWMKMKMPANTMNGSLFSWQIGYCAFSVSSSKISVVKKYITEQEKHHKKMDVQEEVQRFMAEYDVIEFNPEYYWD